MALSHSMVACDLTNEEREGIEIFFRKGEDNAVSLPVKICYYSMCIDFSSFDLRRARNHCISSYFEVRLKNKTESQAFNYAINMPTSYSSLVIESL